MITTQDIKNMQEQLRQAIMREDWETGEKLVKQIAAAKRVAQRTGETCEYCDTPVDAPNFAYHFCTGRKRR